MFVIYKEQAQEYIIQNMEAVLNGKVTDDPGMPGEV